MIAPGRRPWWLAAVAAMAGVEGVTVVRLAREVAGCDGWAGVVRHSDAVPMAVNAGVVLPAAFVAFVVGSRRVLGRDRAAAGRCGVCGYDLRGAAERCPECGAVPHDGRSRPPNDKAAGRRPAASRSP